MEQHNFFNGSRAVVVTGQDRSYSARMYVNCRDGIQNGDATLVARKFTTLNGAQKWAAKVLA
jgi:hypothetical protein